MDQSPAAAAQRLVVKKQALISAVSTGDTEAVVDLLDGGIPIDTKDDEGMSLLHWAARDGHVTTMRLLIRRGCDVDSADSRGLTPLHLAAAMGQTKAVRELIRNAATGQTKVRELIRNAAMGQTKVVRELIKNGAAKSVVAGEFGTPLHHAAVKGHVQTVVAMLEEGCPIDVRNDIGATVLHWAAEGGHVEVVRELVGRGCDVNAVKANGCTPLHIAAAHGRTEAARELIRLGAVKSVDAGVSLCGTPLHSAALGGHVETVEALLEDEVCDLDLTKHDATPSKSQESECNILGPVGVSPVMTAVLFGNVKVFKLLTSKGGSISDRDVHSLSTFEHCFVGGHASKLSQFCEACGIRSSEKGLRGALAALINWGLVDARKILCLCAISGDSVFLEDQFIDLLASDACAMPAAVKCAKFYFLKGVPFLNKLNLPDGNSLNPLHVSLLSFKCFEMGFAASSVQNGTKNHTLFITKLLSHPVLKQTVCENFPNGLSPLDLAQQFEFPDIAALIEGVGGCPGVWADVPREVEVRHPVALPRLKEAYASMKAIAEDGEHGLEFIKGVFSSVLQQPLNSDRPPLLSAEQLDKDGIFRLKPTLSELARLILSRVSTQNWKLVGLLLLEGIADGKDTLNAISHQFSDDRNRFLETLSYWLEHGSSVTWKTLLDALGHFETKHTVDELTNTIVSVLGGAHPVVTMSGPFRPVTSSTLVVSGGAVAAERSPPVRRISDAEGVLCLRRRLPEGDMQDYPPAKRVVRCPLAGSEGIIQAVGFTSSALFVSGRAIAADSSTPVCEDPILCSKPTMLELLDHIVHRVAAHWNQFGLALRVEDYLMDIIKANNRGEVVACCTNMLKRWLRKERGTGGEERSWSTVLEAVQRCLGLEAAWSIAGSLQAAKSPPHPPDELATLATPSDDSTHLATPFDDPTPLATPSDDPDPSTTPEYPIHFTAASDEPASWPYPLMTRPLATPSDGPNLWTHLMDDPSPFQLHTEGKC